MLCFDAVATHCDFTVFDISNKGAISKGDLKRILEQMGEKLNDEDIEEMMREADLDGDGKINFNGKRSSTMKTLKR